MWAKAKVLNGMIASSCAPGAFVDPGGDAAMAVTSWGEAARLRVTAAQTGGRVAILDYRAPVGFGPGRHVHLHDDEIFLVQQGLIALWTPEHARTAGPGDLVFLPRGSPHTWRAYGADPVHLQVIVTPGEFEGFFEALVAQNLTLSDHPEMARVAHTVGVEFLGPPLTEAEVESILRASMSEPRPAYDAAPPDRSSARAVTQVVRD